MGLEEGTAQAALIYIEALDKKLDAALAKTDGERAEIGRRFELHGQAIVNSIPAAVEKASERIEKTMEGMLDAYLERMHSCTDAQDKSIDNMLAIIETLRVSVEGNGATIKEIKKDQKEINAILTNPDTGVIPRIVNLENRPGRYAIKAWQWMAAGGVSMAGVAFGIVSWILSH